MSVDSVLEETSSNNIICNKQLSNCFPPTICCLTDQNNKVKQISSSSCKYYAATF